MAASDPRKIASNGTVSITPRQQIISSCSGAVLTSLMTTPFDVVKVRLQTQQQSLVATTAKQCYVMDCRCLDGVTMCTVTADGTHIPQARLTGTWDGLAKIARLEGLQSWWKGLSPTLLMAVPMTVIYYTGYDQLKQVFGFKNGQRNFLAPALAGSIARTIGVATVCPIEMIRTKLQSRQGYSYRELMTVVRKAVQQNGVLSLWRGLAPMLLRDVPFSIFYWVGYEFSKLKLLQSQVGAVLPSAIPFISGSISGTISAIITNPLDVVKTHMQVEIGQSSMTSSRSLGAGSLRTVIGDVIARHGYSGLYAGLSPRVAKIAPACAIMIASYEACKEYFMEQNTLYSS